MVARPLLQLERLRVEFISNAKSVPVLRDVSFAVASGETVCVVGESGSGKSMTALAILGLIPSPGRVSSGSISFEGSDLTALSSHALQKVRGALISMIFQEPMSSLNPVLTVGDQIAETLRQHKRLTRSEAKAKVVDLLRAVGIPAPEERMRAYPHQLSGGMRQRVMIAIAIACGPRLLIADEPTTALDVTVQKQILGLLKGIQQQSRMAMLLITHDMGIVSEMGDRVVVMYAGQPVEVGSVSSVLQTPRHPYTQALIACAPRVLPGGAVRDRLPEITGAVPAPSEFPRGCAFAPRCSKALDACMSEPPPTLEIEGAQVACWVAAGRSN